MPISRLVTSGPATLSLHEHDFVRIGGVAANDGQRDLRARPCRAARRVPSKTDMSRVGLPSIARIVSRGPQAGLLRRRAVARGDDVEVVAARQLDADVAVGRRLAGFDRLDLAGVEEGAVRVEPVGKPAHRAVHDLVDLHLVT